MLDTERNNPGILLALAGPVAVGKYTITKNLIARNPDQILKVPSITTRAPRINETNGVEYEFVDLSSYQAQKQQDLFMEEVQIGGNFYATRRHYLLPVLSGKDLIWILDMETILNIEEKIAKSFNSDVASQINQRLLKAFIGAPSLVTLKDRYLKSRQRVSGFLDRLQKEWQIWLENKDRYPNLVINNKNLDITVNELEALMSKFR